MRSVPLRIDERALNWNSKVVSRVASRGRVNAMRTKRPLLTPAIMLEVASHMAMGIALGLGFAFILTHVAAFGIGALIDRSADPENTMQGFVMTCATTGALELLQRVVVCGVGRGSASAAAQWLTDRAAGLYSDQGDLIGAPPQLAGKMLGRAGVYA